VFPDQTENAINLAGTASLDADGLNGMATLRLSSNFQSSGASVFSEVTSMVIMQVVRSAGNPSAYVKTSNNSSRLLLQDLGTTWRTLLTLPDSTINSISAIPFQSDVFEIASARAIGDSGATTPVVRVNGIDGTGNGLAVTGFASAPHFVGMNKSTGITEIAELVIIASNTDNATSITVVQMLEGYLAHKWGLTSHLPPSHPYRDTPPASGDCTPELVIDPDSTVIPPNGSQSATTVGVSSGQGESVSWSAASSQDWLTLVDAVGEGSFDSFEFVAGMNPGSTPRTAVVTVTADNGASGSFEVMQQAPCELAGAYDCDNDGLLDTCAIMWGMVIDGNSNGIPDSCETSCPGDVNGDGLVDGADLAAVLGSWGLSGASTADCNQDGFVDGSDLAILLGDWGESCFEPRDPR
jgi:hypothetical protein